MTQQRTILTFILALFAAPPLFAQANLEGREYSTNELAERFEADTFKCVPYRFFQPPALNRGGSEKYPLILSLHGAGGKGSDNLKSLRTWNGVLSEPSFQKNYPCFVVAPQSRSYWLDSRANSPDVSEAALKTYPACWSKALGAAGFCCG